MKAIKSAAAGLLLSTIAAPAMTATVVGLSGENELHWLDTDSWTRTGGVTVTGVEGRLLGIDVRPADGMLYGVFADGTLASIDPMTGVATKVSTLTTKLADGVSATVDFNPVADRLRGDGQRWHQPACECGNGRSGDRRQPRLRRWHRAERDRGGLYQLL